MDEDGVGQRFVQVKTNWISENVRSHLLVVVERETPTNEGSRQVPSPKLRTAQVHTAYSSMKAPNYSFLQIECLLFYATLKRFSCVGLRTPASVTLVIRVSDCLIWLPPPLLAMLGWADGDARWF